MNELRRKIEQEIRERGPIPFSRYMEMCLYDAEFGYYSRHAAQFGKAGDFYTSSDVHAVFGRLLARQFDEMWRVLGSPENMVIRELGPGRGLFAQDVLDWSEKKFPEFFRALRYVLVENSPALQQRIEATLSRHLESGKAELGASPEIQKDASPPNVDLYPEAATERQKGAAHGARRGSGADNNPAPEGRKTTLTEEPPTVLFANEFFDAIPVEVVSSRGSLRIDCLEGQFVETWVPSSAGELEFLDRHSIHPEDSERAEVPLRSQAEMATACGFERGFLVVVDYGYTREEQLAGRHRGTLKAIRQHSVSANPYEAPGEQDITADVNFTALAAVAEQRGFCAQKLITQSQFLMGIGEANQLADAFAECRLPQERTKVALQLKHLVTPAGMGESFHVLLASKGIEAKKGAALAGLNFARR